MIELVRETYIDVLKRTKLLDKRTAEFAIEKIKAMDKHVAFPEYLRNRTVIYEQYENVCSYICHFIRSQSLNIIKSCFLLCSS